MHMQFSENQDNSYFFSQPHQPFFVLAFVNAIVTMFVFILAYQGVIYIQIPTSNFHAYGFINLLFTPAFFAFLFTTFPRFSSTPAIEQKTYMRVFTFYYLGATLFLLGSIVSPIFSTFGMILVFIGNTLGVLILKNIYQKTLIQDKHDLYWILLAISIGVVAHFLFIIGSLWSPNMVGLSTEIATYLYLFLLTYSVAQRMVPFFSHCMVEKNTSIIKKIVILLSLHILVEGFIPNSSFFIDLYIGYLLYQELKRWQLPFPNPNPLLWILHIALYWSALAFILGGISNAISLMSDISFLALDIHVLLLGFVFTILIGFGTRVTLGHSGNAMHADRYTSFLFYWTQVVVATRILVSLFSGFGFDFMLVVNISATVWLIMFGAWGLRFFTVLIKGTKLN